MFFFRRGIISGQGFSTAVASAGVKKPWLLVGLGNPGDKYKFTRHNVGFDMIDVFAKSVGISMDTIHFKALFGQGFVGEVPVLLAKPQTYMNLSGESVGPLAAYYKLPLDRVIVIFDDMELSCGILRLQPRGGHGAHKGIMNVMKHFRGNKDFGRLRIGIGKPPGQMDPKAYVLQKFNKTANNQIDDALHEGVQLLKTVLVKGLAECMSSINTEQKYKYVRQVN
ncbi:Peptidyl-tRNA hydrolase [Zostera marina]|uniref:Peptidyl-tRNA hydrolase n=1 Tax=Zostera marina TaxID=29655 RepID=A0A0K9PAF5_ZOSMR|nr:Peptidyl-tRNA hydrolase [Zostera marina]